MPHAIVLEYLVYPLVMSSSMLYIRFAKLDFYYYICHGLAMGLFQSLKESKGLRKRCLPNPTTVCTSYPKRCHPLVIFLTQPCSLWCVGVTWHSSMQQQSIIKDEPSTSNKNQWDHIHLLHTSIQWHPEKVLCLLLWWKNIYRVWRQTVKMMTMFIIMTLLLCCGVSPLALRFHRGCLRSLIVYSFPS